MPASEATYYDDGRVIIDDAGVTLRRYYFPFATAKRIPFAQIRGIETRPMGIWTGKGRLWGSSSLRYWMPLDLGRPHRSQMVVLDLGAMVHPAFSPDDPERVMDLIRQRLSADR